MSTVRQLALIVSHCVYVTGMLSQSSKMSVIFGKLSRLLPLLKHPVVYSGIQNPNEKSFLLHCLIKYVLLAHIQFKATLYLEVRFVSYTTV